ncbi:MAG: hypothetical protein F6K58_17040 [Symploca sp. SIO2E9]|nr:hypothetical protein [Symploca sp. SIO2E9]
MSNKRTGLGESPLSGGLFQKTELGTNPGEKIQPKAQSKNVDSTLQNIESTFLRDVEDSGIRKEPTGSRITYEISDWVNNLVSEGRRKNGHKIPKEVWVQAGLELLRAMPVEWSDVEDLEALRDKLSKIALTIHEHWKF